MPLLPEVRPDTHYADEFHRHGPAGRIDRLRLEAMCWLSISLTRCVRPYGVAVPAVLVATVAGFPLALPAA